VDAANNAYEGVSNSIISGLRTVVRAATEFAKCKDLDELYKRGVQFALSELNIERCAIFVVDGNYLQGTYGTNAKGEFVDERGQRFPIEDVWVDRIGNLDPNGAAWTLVEGIQNEWDGVKAVKVGDGWVAITPIFSSGELIAIFVNDCAVSGKPVDYAIQEVVSVYCSMFGRIIERKKADLKLHEERNLLRTLIDTLPDFIYVKDINSRLIIHNAAHAKASGASNPEENIGKSDFDLFAPELASVYFAADQQVLRTGQALINYEERGHDVNGDPAWLLTTKVPLRDKDGRVTGIVGMTRDITQLKAAQAALERSNEALEERVQRRVEELSQANIALQNEMNERRRVEDQLQRERNLLRTVIDHAPDQIYVKDLESRFVLASLNCAEVIGVDSVEELIGKADSDFYTEDHWQSFYEDEQRVMKTGVPLISHEEVNVNRYGIERWLLTTKVPLRDNRGQVIGLVGVSRDITERKLAEKQLRESEELFAKAFHASPLASCIVRLATGTFLDLNNRYLELTGYDRSDLIGRPSIELPLMVQNDDQLQLLKIITEQGGVRDYEITLVKKSGERREVVFSAEAIELNGETCALVMAQDITERKNMQKALLDERKLLRTLLDALPDYIFVKDRTGRFILSNLAHARAAGVINPYDFAGKMAADFFPAELAAQYDADDQAVMDSGWALISAERTTLDAFGKLMYVSTTKVPLRDESDKIVGVVGISRDITEKRRTENILRESEERYRSLFELSPDGIVVCYDKTIVYTNNAAVHLFGAASVDDVVGRSSEEIMSTQDVDRLHSLSPTSSAVAGKVVSMETKLRRLDGSFIDVELMAAPVTFADMAGVQIIIRDVSERLQAEIAKRESERLRIALEKEKELRDLRSKLMVTISHEFRTPMTIAQSSADILEDYFDRLPAEKRKEHLAKIIGQIQLLTEMMEDINFIIQASFEELTVKAEPVNLKQLCETIIGEMHTSDAVFHRIELLCADEIPPLTLDLRRIKYVITNLLSNAMKYSERDTMVRLGVEQQGDQVMITVEDEGIGISAEEQTRIFEPFYRGHNVGVIRGTGIGLSIVKEIVDQHKGTIHLDSELGHGTKVTIALPVSPVSTEASPQ
jgi:PAS domain S-box-containing protein